MRATFKNMCNTRSKILVNNIEIQHLVIMLILILEYNSNICRVTTLKKRDKTLSKMPEFYREKLLTNDAKYLEVDNDF